MESLEVAEISLDGRQAYWGLELAVGPGQCPTHLHAKLANLQLQLLHLGLPLSHHGPQLGDEAAALLSLTVDPLVQAELRSPGLLLLQTQAAQDLL